MVVGWDKLHGMGCGVPDPAMLPGVRDPPGYSCPSQLRAAVGACPPEHLAPTFPAEGAQCAGVY